MRFWMQPWPFQKDVQSCRCFNSTNFVGFYSLFIIILIIIILFYLFLVMVFMNNRIILVPCFTSTVFKFLMSESISQGHSSSLLSIDGVFGLERKFLVGKHTVCFYKVKLDFSLYDLLCDFCSSFVFSQLINVALNFHIT